MKKRQGQTTVFREIGAIEPLKTVASSPQGERIVPLVLSSNPVDVNFFFEFHIGRDQFRLTWKGISSHYNTIDSRATVKADICV